MPSSQFGPELLHKALLGVVDGAERDLSLRQLAVLLLCYLERGPHTVGAVAQQLNVQHATISRVIDRLQGAKLMSRQRDPQNRRSVFLCRTSKGQAYVERLQEKFS